MINQTNVLPMALVSQPTHKTLISKISLDSPPQGSSLQQLKTSLDDQAPHNKYSSVILAPYSTIYCTGMVGCWSNLCNSQCLPLDCKGGGREIVLTTSVLKRHGWDCKVALKSMHGNYLGGDEGADHSWNGGGFGRTFPNNCESTHRNEGSGDI